MREVLLFLLMVGLVIDAHGGELVVARSSDPAHAPGDVIDGSRVLYIARDHAVSLIAEDGRLLRIAGPYQGMPDPGAAPQRTRRSILSTLSELLKTSSAVTTMTVFRGSPGAGSASSLHVDVEGVRCTAGRRPPGLRRDDATVAEVLEIEASGAPVVRMHWPSASRLLPWPEEVRYAPGSEYRFSFPNRPGAMSLRLITARADTPSTAHVAAWMAEQGCRDDARRALARLLR
jgi:hypothetical protein